MSNPCVASAAACSAAATAASTAASTVVELQGISRHFGQAPAIVRALDQVDLRIEAGEHLAIMGSSGSGKSSLLNILGLLDRPDAGIYRFEGLDVNALDERRRAGIRGQRIGFVFQSFHLLAHRSVLENVSLCEVYRAESRAGRAERAMVALERVGMLHRKDQFPPRLSGGERQRVAIARGLMGSPALLLCDEPTGNLDSDNTAIVLRLLDGLVAEGLTLVVITHEREVAERAKRRLRMRDGRLDEVSPASAA
jgi:putative ABC transport system ATP-binding protein